MQEIEKICQKIVDLDIGLLPEEILEVVKISIADTVGVTVLGSQEPCVGIIKKTLLVEKFDIGSSLIGLAKFDKLSIYNAALVNGVSAHALDFDDTGASTQSHPSAVLLPSLFSLAEYKNYSGSKIIEAYVAGVEFFSRLSKTVPMLHLKGWHPSSVLGTVASAVACSKLLNLNSSQIINAIALSCTQSSGLVVNFGTMSKPFHIGMASSNGLLAAMLAKNGFRASSSVFEGNFSFFNTISGNIQDNISEYFSDFGTNFYLLNPGLNIKQYPSCSLSHRSIDIVLNLCKINTINFNDIKSIICRSTPRAKKILYYQTVNNPLEGKFCMPFLLACAVVDNKVIPDSFSEKKVKDTEIIDIMNKVDFDIHSDWKDGVDDWRPDIVSIIMKDNTIYEGSLVYPKGHAKNPLSWTEIEEKYYNCVKNNLNKNQYEKSIKLIKKFEELKNLDELFVNITKNKTEC